MFVDFDRTGSSPPKQNSQLTTTPYTPGSGQKRFNPFMKDTPTSQSANIDEHTHTTTTQLSDTHHQNDENRNIILLHGGGDDDDDGGDNNQNILGTPNNDNNTTQHHSNSQKSSSQTPKTKYIEDDGSPAKTIHSDSDSNEMTGSVHNETPLPDWIALNESVLIRPYNHSGVISFIGPTHFSVCICFDSFDFSFISKHFPNSSKCNN